MGIPAIFLDYFFKQRVEIIESLCHGKPLKEHFLIAFTRTTPVVITDGSAGLSGSVKMVGFIPRRELIREYAEKAEYYAYINRPGNMRETACILLREFYVLENIDTNLIGGLEMGFKHSWTNIRETRRATLLFYTPPDTSFEVRTIVEIHEDDNDPYKRYLNALHDLFHYTGRKSNYPAYIFHIREIYDNSNTREGFGKKIYP